MLSSPSETRRINYLISLICIPLALRQWMVLSISKSLSVNTRTAARVLNKRCYAVLAIYKQYFSGNFKKGIDL